MSISHTIFVATPISNALNVYEDIRSAVISFTKENNLPYPQIKAHNFSSFSLIGSDEDKNSYWIFMTHSASHDFKETYDGEKIQVIIRPENSEFAFPIIEGMRLHGKIYERKDDSVTSDFVEVK